MATDPARHHLGFATGVTNSTAMNSFRAIWSRFRSLRQRRAVKREVDEELRFHIERRTAENIAGGMSPDEAAREARKRFGNFQSVREACCSTRGASFGETTFQDMRFGLRILRKNPGFTVVAVFILALGVAAVTTIFTFVDSILLNPLPFPKPGELVEICDFQQKQGISSPLIGIPDLEDWRQQATTFSAMAYYGVGTMALTGDGDAEPVQQVRVSDDFASVLQVKPFIGHWFAPADFAFGPDHVCMITYELWMRRFGGDPNIIGKSLTLNGNSVQVIGVMPRGFEFPEKTSIALTSGFINWEKRHRELRWFNAIGRLKPGVPLQAAQVELEAIAKRLEQTYPNTDSGHSVKVVRLKDQIVGGTARALGVLMGAVCCVLLIACANIASLLLVRGIERKKEFAVRIALGASRRRIAKQQLTEILLLAVLGGVVSIFASYWCVKFLVALSPARIPRLDEVQLNHVALLFCLAVSVVCAAVFSLAPILQTFRTNLVEDLNEEGKAGAGSYKTGWARNAILLLQVAMTIVLTIGAGLFLRSYSKIEHVNLGFNPEHVAVSKIALRTSQFPSDWNRMTLFKPLLARLEQIPGKKSIALVGRPPFVPPFMVTMGVDGIPQAPDEKLKARFNSVSDGYFDTMGMRIIAGRDYDSRDNENSLRVVIVNQCLARKYFGGQNPIGQRITVQGNGTNLFAVVGVVNDVHQDSFIKDPEPELYFHCMQINEPLIHVVVKVEHDRDLKSVCSGIREALRAIDNRQAAGDLQTFDSVLSRSLQQQRFVTFLLTCFAVIAMVLSAVGIFGFLSYTVGRRTREIGILSALGAPRGSIVGKIMQETIVVIALGVLVGLAASLVLSRLIESLLFEVAARDTLTFLAVPMFVAAVAVLAAYLPTRKAINQNIMSALRSS